MSIGELELFIQKIQEWYDQVKEVYETRILTHDSMTERLKQSGHGKHALQQASLLGHMERLGLLNDESVMMEFGAGKAELSSRVHFALTQKGIHAPFLLIDRGSFKNKYDKRMRDTPLERIRIDIKDLNLARVQSLSSKPHAVCFSKHLCGAATDLTLESLSSFIQSHPKGLKGLVIALCCHHCMSFETYSNHAYLSSLGIGEQEFNGLCRISSWATSGSRGDGSDQEEVEEETRLAMSTLERQAIGQQCKRVLDMGRVRFLRDLGLRAGMDVYVSSQVSLENVVLWATRDA